jgi:hypothetical protein
MKKSKSELSELLSELKDSLKDFLKGKTPLLIQFWGIYFFGFNVVFSIVLYFMFGIKIMYFIFLIMWLPLAFSTWNSASNYKRKKIWSFIAKSYIVLNGSVIFLNNIEYFFNINFFTD